MVHQHHRHLHQARDFGTFLDDLGNAVGLGSSNDKAEKREGSTIYVYQTMPKTFTEGVAGYSTSLPNGVPTSILVDASTPTPTPTPTPKSKSAASKHSTTAEAKTTAKTALAGLPSSIVPSSTLDTSNSEVLLASQTEATSETTTPTPTISPSTTPTAIPSSTPSSGMISGAKAGLAIGIIVVIGAILSLIFFCFRQRKKAEERERLDDEKFTNVPPPAAAAAGGPASMRGLKRLSTAPRLDVRPTTAFFMPNRASQMQNPNAAAAAGNGIQMTSQNRGPAMEQNRANPFGNHAEAIDPVNAAGPSIVDGVSAAGVVVAGAAASARGPVRSTSRGAQNKYAGNKAAQSPFSDAARTDGNRGAQNTSQQMHNTGVMPQPLSGVIEESSASGPVSPTAAAVVVGAASDTNLYRVHLDFSPSMPDELKVRGGEIVKLLKEFDDGWCMCIKEDGSAEGVLPRTCISNSPIAARRSPSNKSIPGPFQNNQRRHSPPSGSNGSSAPLYPSHQDQGQGQGQNRAGPPMNNNNRGPQYRPQQGQGQGRPQQGRPQQGRPMSPAMSANGRNSPGPGNYAQGSGPQYRPQQGPMSPTMNRGPPQAQQSPQTPQQQQGQQQQSPSSPPPHAISSPPPSSSGATAGSSSPAQVPLPSSPALSQGSGGFSIPEVTVTAPSGVAGVVVERKPVGVGRKPVPGQ